MGTLFPDLVIDLERDGMVDIRWKQRLENLTRAFDRLNELTQKVELNWIEETALIKMFEIVFELSWKTLKDYLSEQGINVKSPRETLKQAFRMELIEDGDCWLDAMEKRSAMVHRYDDDYARTLAAIIRNEYASQFRQLHQMLIKLAADG